MNSISPGGDDAEQQGGAGRPRAQQVQQGQLGGGHRDCGPSYQYSLQYNLL